MPSLRPLKLATRAVIFDLDGVLVWTVPMHWWAFRETFRPEGRDFTLAEYLRVGLGASREEVIRAVLGPLAPDRMAALMAAKEEHVREYLRQKGVEAIPGALDFARAVRARGVRTAVASASRTPRLLLESLAADAIFEAIIDRNMVARSKPDPDLYLLCAETLGVSPAACLVIEDSPVGIDAARAANMRVLALTTTHDRASLKHADAVFASFAAIPLESWLDADS